MDDVAISGLRGIHHKITLITTPLEGEEGKKSKGEILITLRQISLDIIVQVFYYYDKSDGEFIMTEEIKKNRFAKGNQCARKHGFYSKVLDEKQQHDFQEAVEVEGFDEEIALLRVKIKSLLEHNPENMRLITQAVNALSKLVMIKYNIGHEDKQGLKEIIIGVLKDVAVPLGFTIGTSIKK